MSQWTRLLMRDVRYGFASVVGRFVLVACAAGLALFLAHVAVAAKVPELAGSLTLGERLLCAWRGMLPYVPSDGTPFPFPMAWFALLICCLYVSLDYPSRDLGGMGASVIVACRSRWAWWASKCVWVIAASIACWGIVALLALVLTVVAGGEMTLNVRPVIVWALNAGRGDVVSTAARLVSSGEVGEAAVGVAAMSISDALVASAAALVSVMLLQGVVALVTNPVAGMATGVSVLFASAYFRAWWLPGEYLMLARTEVLMRGGFQPLVGVLIAVGVSVLAVVFGGCFFARRDILAKGVEP